MTTSICPTIRPTNEPARRVWDAGGPGYDQISRQIAEAIEHCVGTRRT